MICNGFVSGSSIHREQEGTRSQKSDSTSKQRNIGSFFSTKEGPRFKREKREYPPLSSKDCYETLKKVFGYDDYKGKQKEIIEAAIDGLDVLVVAPTGMGKSACFQIPAAAESHGVTLIISPLLALMKNQISRLEDLKVPAAAYTSDISVRKRKKVQILSDLQSVDPSTRLLYLTPEMLCKGDFDKNISNLYQRGKINRLVIDEAHCISEWGHDFRSEYRKLGSFREKYPDVPLMALTASATASVQRDIIENLGMANERMRHVLHPFNRENIYYEVRYIADMSPAERMADVHQFIAMLHQRRGRPSSGIVYCRHRATCDELSDYLRRSGINARPYHRGLKSKELDKTLKEWTGGGNGECGVDVVVATIAFGMGIDKSDVRYIVHYDLPKSMEGYYQETGRAGRDGEASKCILYYSREDALAVNSLVKRSYNERKQAALDFTLFSAPEPSQRGVNSFGALVNLAENVLQCRHLSICRYFGEEIDENNEEQRKSYCDGMCDVCKYPEKTKRRKIALSDEEGVLAQIERLKKRATLGEDEKEVDCQSRDDTSQISKDEDWGEEEEEEEEEGRYSSENEAEVPTSGQYYKPGPSIPKPIIKVNASNNKRTSDEASLCATDNAKLRKVDYSKPSYASGALGSLKKPFKAPFKVPFKDLSKEALRRPQNSSTHKDEIHPDGQLTRDQTTGPIPDPASQKSSTSKEGHYDDEGYKEMLLRVNDNEANEQNGNVQYMKPEEDIMVIQKEEMQPQIAKNALEKLEEVELELRDDLNSREVYDLSANYSKPSIQNNRRPTTDEESSEEEDEGLEAQFSQKILKSLREQSLAKIKGKLQEVLIKDRRTERIWIISKVRSPLLTERAKLLGAIAREVEFSVFLLSVTDKGYKSRISECLEAIAKLAEEKSWDQKDNASYDQTRDIVDILCRVVKLKRR